MPSHLDALQTPTPVNLRRFPREVHSVAKQASFCIASRRYFSWFWSDFRRFWELNTDAKIDFWIIFCDVFFECVLASIFRRFLGTPTLKNQQKPLFFQWFLLICRKSTSSKQMRKTLDFGNVCGGQNHEKSRKNGVESHAFSWHRFFIAFFRFFTILPRFWEAPGGSKNQ